MRSLYPLRVIVLIGLFAWLAIKAMSSPPVPDWRSGELVAVVPDKSMVTDSAFESDLLALFGKHLNLRVKLLKLPPDEAVAALLAGRAHLAAGFRSHSNPSLRYSTSYQRLDERVVCDERTPRSIGGLYARQLVVARESAQEWALRKVREEYDELVWESRRETTATQLLQALAEGEIDCTVANDEQLATLRNYFPDLGSGLSLNSDSELSWAISAEGDQSLLEEANAFFAGIRNSRELQHAIDRYYGHNDRLNAIDITAFIADVRDVLSRYRQWFEDAGGLTGIDWRLLAALAYRESRWDPNATSYTNVRGMMMLTESTADRMGVANRLDPRESIMAGARYLQLLKEQLPLRITEQNRLWMALAAYNQGMGHLEDARIMTLQRGLDPDVWADVKRVMPLLSRPEYAQNTKFGRARGGEAVVHVETVRLYHDMLKRLDAEGKLPDALLFPFLSAN
ncbi:membrane-bound lytic murein transglycosylase MltF [Ferrigenium sp. UT5]|uniref:membrane-bound lytic murein transglycosylase MltF n=1 Tax=Ferrigenium sp. UT5 TaxID=3242105 RepID=UPI0035513DE5